MADPVEVMARAIARARFPGATPLDRVKFKSSSRDAQAAISDLDAAGFAVVPKGIVEATRGLLRSEYESEEPGLCDCIDNSGTPYQSQYLADQIKMAEAALAQVKP